MAYTQNRLKELREERDIKQTTAAEDLNISRAMLSNYESGKMPSLRNGIKLAQYYHVSLDYIFGLSADKGTTDGAVTSAFTTLAGVAANSAPAASDVVDLANAAILYKCNGAPCGEKPLAAWRDFMRHLTDALNAASTGNKARLIDSANAATVAALEITKMPAAFYEKNERGI